MSRWVLQVQWLQSYSWRYPSAQLDRLHHHSGGGDPIGWPRQESSHLRHHPHLPQEMVELAAEAL